MESKTLGEAYRERMKSETLGDIQRRKQRKSLAWKKPVLMVAVFLIVISLFGATTFLLNNKDLEKSSGEIEKSSIEELKRNDRILVKAIKQLRQQLSEMENKIAESDERFNSTQIPKNTSSVSKSEVSSIVRYHLNCHEGKFRGNENARKQDPNCIPYHTSE